MYSIIQAMNYSDAAKKRWTKVSLEKRKKRMSALAKKRWAKTNAKQRSAYAINMLEKRWKK